MNANTEAADLSKVDRNSGQSMQFSPQISKVDVQTQHEIEQFYYRESWLLDNRKFKDWFALLDDDIRYFMPLRTSRIQREGALEFSGDKEFAHFDDDIKTMKGRVRKLLSDVGWSENPASRTRHIVSNVIVNTLDSGDVYEVSSAFLLYRNRSENQVDVFAGERRDVLRRRADGIGFGIGKRIILIDQSTINSNNLSILF